MMITPRMTAAVAVGWLALASAVVAAPAYSIKVVANTAPPKALGAAFSKLVENTCIQLQDDKGNTLLELWMRKDVPVKATDAQIKNGITYREVPQSTFMAVARVVKPLTDYKKQRIPAGLYTLRLAIQPQDGDHMGTAPYNEFCLFCPAAEDKKPEPLTVKDLRELSTKSTDNHPGVFVLFPADKDAGDKPKLTSKPENHWVLFLKLPASVGGKKAVLPFGLTVIGVSASA